MMKKTIFIAMFLLAVGLVASAQRYDVNMVRQTYPNQLTLKWVSSDWAQITLFFEIENFSHTTSQFVLAKNAYIVDEENHQFPLIDYSGISSIPKRLKPHKKKEFSLTFRKTSSNAKKIQFVIPGVTTFQDIVLGAPAEQKRQIVEPVAVEEEAVLAESDVDIQIPVGGRRSSNTVAVIIGNENYNAKNGVSASSFSIRDAASFRSYCVQTLGVPSENIRYAEDASLAQMLTLVDWLDKVSDVWDGNAQIIFYYSGHGIPNERTQSAMILPVDGTPSNENTCYSLDELYRRLGRMKKKNCVVLLDACFSGSSRDDEMLVADARAAAIKANQGDPIGDVVVMTASQGVETAYPYKAQQHGMFTYFLLKKLQETRGDVKLGDLSEYVRDQVRRKSLLRNDKVQTPAVLSSPSFSKKWRDLKLGE